MAGFGLGRHANGEGLSSQPLVLNHGFGPSSRSRGRVEKEVEKTCEDFNGFCEDCFTQVFCLQGDNEGENTLPCGDGLVCVEVDSYSACVEPSEAPQCQCPGEGIVQVADPYDNQKFITWIDCEGHVSPCPSDEFFNEYTGECVGMEPTSFPITPSPQTCPDDGSFALAMVSCTSYRFCFDEQSTSAVQFCEPGEYFDVDEDECMKYLPFSCPDEMETMLYGDPHDCSMFYLCSEGNQVGSVSTCPEGQNFDSEAQGCVDEAIADCVPIVDCGICPDAVTTFGVDCERYYQCTTSTDPASDLDFVLVLKTCPTGFYYDSESGYCTKTVEGCSD